MKRTALYIWLLLSALLYLTAACDKEDNYVYPSVKLEFVTVSAGADGNIETLQPDDGAPLPVSQDRTATTLPANSRKRVLVHYETVTTDNVSTAVIYSLQSLITPTPKPADDPAYKEGLKHDPVEMVSIWSSGGYLNMILSIKVNTGKQHVLGMVEESTALETEGVVELLLYHDNGGDEPYYNRRAYVSVPLEKYATFATPEKPVKLKFTYYTYDAAGGTVKSEKYREPGFSYPPTKN